MADSFVATKGQMQECCVCEIISVVKMQCNAPSPQKALETQPLAWYYSCLVVEVFLVLQLAKKSTVGMPAHLISLYVLVSRTCTYYCLFALPLRQVALEASVCTIAHPSATLSIGAKIVLLMYMFLC